MKVVWKGDGKTYEVLGQDSIYYYVGDDVWLLKERCKILPEKKHSHYHKDVSSLETVDVYKVCELFDVQDASGALHHAIKKLLCSGYRGVKDKKQDVQEAVDTLNRWLEMNEEK